MNKQEFVSILKTDGGFYNLVELSYDYENLMQELWGEIDDALKVVVVDVACHLSIFSVIEKGISLRNKKIWQVALDGMVAKPSLKNKQLLLEEVGNRNLQNKCDAIFVEWALEAIGQIEELL